VKLGCSKIDNIEYAMPPQKGNSLYLDFDNGFGYWSGALNLGVKILYVHQLQNLYFALTGKELEIKQ
jgi:hypothetical protein